MRILWELKFLVALLVVTGGLLGESRVEAAGGTMQVASKGETVTALPDWPEGLESLLNDAARGDGWQSWFTEWPNDVVHYQFQAGNMQEVNRLIARFAKIESAGLQVRLSLGKEPRGFGWVSQLEAGNNTPILFSMGNQKRLDEWFKRLPEGKFGVMQFEKAPVAVPPTLTLFVQNQAIDVRRLVIPAHVQVSAGYLPGNFHIANLREAKAAPAVKAAELDAETKKAADEIEAFIASRRKSGL